jgi:Fic family protein
VIQKYYNITLTDELKQLLQTIDDLKLQIDINTLSHKERLAAIQEKLRIDWTYESNAIEGSSLTKGETLFFLQEGLTVEGKPLKDFLDARNHAEAIDWLYDIINDNRPVTEGLIKEINALLLSGVHYTEAINESGRKVRKPLTPGQYKSLPNHVLQPDGAIFFYTEPIHVPDEMQMLCQWINHNLDILHPLITASIAHYNMVRIHPFDDGNGRGARILMNLILIKKGYSPAIIKMEKRRSYLTALSQADKGDISQFVMLVAVSLINTQRLILEKLN